MKLQRQYFLLSYLKTPSFCPVRIWTNDVRHTFPMLNQLSQPVSGREWRSYAIGGKKGWLEHMRKWVEREEFIDSMRVKIGFQILQDFYDTKQIYHRY